MPLKPPDWINAPAPPPITHGGPKATGDNLAVWGMFAGLIGVLLSPFAGGFLFGPVGLVFAAMAQSRPMKNASRITAAMGLSVAGILISTFVSVSGFEKLFAGGIYGWEGARAPDFTLTTADGNTMRLSDLRGKRVFVNIWATWCPPCRAMQPDLNRLATEWAAKDVVVLGLSNDNDESVLLNYIKRNRLEYEVGWMYENFPKPYSDVSALPTLFVVDRNGVIIAVEVGQHSYAALTALAALPDYPGAPKDPPGGKS